MKRRNGRGNVSTVNLPSGCVWRIIAFWTNYINSSGNAFCFHSARTCKCVTSESKRGSIYIYIYISSIWATLEYSLATDLKREPLKSRNILETII